MIKHQNISTDIGWRSTLNSLGIDADEILNKNQLPENFISLFDLNLSTDKFFNFWRVVEDKANNPLLPLLIIGRVNPIAFHSTIFSALCSYNLMQAAQRLARHKQIMMPLILDIEVSNNGDMTLRPRWHEALTEVPTSLACTVVAFFLKLARLGTRTNVVPLKVTLPELPELEYLENFEDFFGVTFTQSRSASITFSAIEALNPFLTANEGMWKVYESIILQNRHATQSADTPASERVKATIIEMLSSNNTTIETVSERLSISKRTLQRKLCEEGVTFRSTLSDIRKMLAKHYLSNTKMSGVDIAFLLGFENPNSFYRAFNSWLGSTTEEYRRKTASKHSSAS